VYELVPILAGVLAGIGAAQLRSRSARVALVATIGLAAAVIAGLASGELAESWAFLLWDTAQACAAAALVLVGLPALRSVRGRIDA
jgi:hypothetical protein